MRTNRLRSFVETGTYFGDTAHFIASKGYDVTTIELEPRLAVWARQRFANDRRVRVLEGDSGELLPSVLAALDGPAMIYLDGHFIRGGAVDTGAGNPVSRELRAVLDLAKRGSVVVIDDARCFGTDPDYPELREVLVMLSRSGIEAEVSGDQIVFKL